MPLIGRSPVEKTSLQHADFVAAAHQKKLLKPSIQDEIKSVDDYQKYAVGLVAFIDAATEKHLDPDTNRKMYANQTVSSMAASGMTMMNWAD